MRVTANIPAANLTTTLTPSATDRHVPLHVFVPKTIKVSSAAQQRQDMFIVDAIRLMIWKYLDPTFHVVDFKPRLSILEEFKQSIVFGASATKPKKKVPAPPTGLKPLMQKLVAANTPDDILLAIEAIKSDPQMPHYFTPINPPPGTPLGPPKLTNSIGRFNNIVDLLRYVPWRYGPDASEIGYLFLDRTRCRQVGFEIGEHIDSLALGPGEEAVFELRTSRKESTSVEDTIEREFESTLEQTSEESLTQAVTDTLQTSQTGTSSSTVSPSVRIPADVAKVDASLSASSSGSFSNAVNNSRQNSTTLAVQNSRKASAKLRQNHRMTIKSGVETGIETFSRRLIKNPNSATPITLHYFKMMQKVEMQQERTGVRLCWAPFVLDPGSRLSMQMSLARHLVRKRALSIVEVPPEPTPPKRQMAPFWKESEEDIVSKTAVGRFNDEFYLLVKIASNETYTGSASLVKTGSGADRAEVTLFDDIPDRPTEEGYVTARGLVFSDVDLLRMSDTVALKLRVEVLRQLPGYQNQYLEYQRLLDEHKKEVKRLKRAAEAEAKPAADAAAARVLATADIRAELISAVVRQYIDLLPDREAREIDLWHRIIDFDNVTFKLYPGWWQGGRQRPEFSAQHFLNASLARVFLPIRPGYEEQFFSRLFHPKRVKGISMNEYTSYVKSVVKDLREEQKKFTDVKKMPMVTPIGVPWTDYVPTNGTHVEAELSATTAADLVTERQLEATAARLEADVAAITEENRIRQLTTAASATEVVVGPSK